MHLCTLAIDRLMYSTSMSLCDSAMDLALHCFNREQGVDGPTLFLSSRLLHEQVDIAPNTAIDGRRPLDCRCVVKCINIDTQHWIAAVWCRLQPATVFILDSLAPAAATTTKRLRTSSYTVHVTHFLRFCEELSGSDRTSVNVAVLPAARQSDSSSCGVFVIEFCRELCRAGADVTGACTRRLLQEVGVEDTRRWLEQLSRTLGH